MARRQFGFAFLLFVPYLAYWGYDYWLKWYRKYYIKSKSLDSTDAPPKGQEEDPAITESATNSDLDKITASQLETIPTVEDYQRVIADVDQGFVSSHDCDVLIHMLRSSDTMMLTDGLKLVESISVKSSVPAKRLLFESTINKELLRLLRARKEIEASKLKQIIIIINNLSLSEDGQSKLQITTSDMIDLSLADDESLASLALQCLANLSVTPAGHMTFAKAVHLLYCLMDSYPERTVYILRILINLSTNPSLVPYLLAAQKPKRSLELLDSSAEVTNRWLRFLVNVSDTVLSENIKENELPVTYKASSPDTMYAFLYSKSNHEQVTSTLLTQPNTAYNAESERKELANRLYKSVKLKVIAESGP